MIVELRTKSGKEFNIYNSVISSIMYSCEKEMIGNELYKVKQGYIISFNDDSEIHINDSNVEYIREKFK